MAWGSFGIPRDAEYRWLRGLRAASASFSTATSGEGRSGLPNPKSITSRPARRIASFKSLIVAKTYGGSPLIRRNSIASRVLGRRGRLGPWSGGPELIGSGCELAEVQRPSEHQP